MCVCACVCVCMCVCVHVWEGGGVRIQRKTVFRIQRKTVFRIQRKTVFRIQRKTVFRIQRKTVFRIQRKTVFCIQRKTVFRIERKTILNSVKPFSYHCKIRKHFIGFRKTIPTVLTHLYGTDIFGKIRLKLFKSWNGILRRSLNKHGMKDVIFIDNMHGVDWVSSFIKRHNMTKRIADNVKAACAKVSAENINEY